MSSSRPARIGSKSQDVANEAAQALFDLMMSQKLCFAGIAADFGCSPVQAMTLFNLSPTEPVAMSTFAQRMRCEPSNITGVIDKLEARGLVERRAVKGDRRVKLLYVTSEGAKLRAKLAAELSKPPDWMLALSVEHQRQLRDVLREALAHERQKSSASDELDPPVQPHHRRV